MRGLTDPTPEDITSGPQDLPSVQEMDQAIMQLFEVVNSLQTQIDMIKDILGASIGTANRDKHLKGL
jgi:hypothetical protein